MKGFAFKPFYDNVAMHYVFHQVGDLSRILHGQLRGAVLKILCLHTRTQSVIAKLHSMMLSSRRTQHHFVQEQFDNILGNMFRTTCTAKHDLPTSAAKIKNPSQARILCMHHMSACTKQQGFCLCSPASGSARYTTRTG